MRNWEFFAMSTTFDLRDSLSEKSPASQSKSALQRSCHLTMKGSAEHELDRK